MNISFGALMEGIMTTNTEKLEFEEGGERVLTAILEFLENHESDAKI